ncbi:MAG: 16S rRNA (guanine(966)-N(2))-methyltransferase RsmD [Arcobacteraceae bacterium]
MKNKVISKIVGGKYKNRVIELPSLEVTRSSKSILKESFFNVLQFDIIDTLFIEAFGGSGGIGLEALSRGAKHSYFCEINKQSFKTLQKNCAAIEPESCTTLFGDTFEKIPNLINQLADQKSVQENDIILYLDPPFDIREGMTDIYENTFDIVRGITNRNVVLVTFEHMTGLEMPEKLGHFEKYKTKKFGKSSLTYYRV